VADILLHGECVSASGGTVTFDSVSTVIDFALYILLPFYCSVFCVLGYYYYYC
jgi:hypothetical protein